MQMIEYTSQVIAHQREAEIVRAAEERRMALERLAATPAHALREVARRGQGVHRSPRPGWAVRGLRRALRTPRPLSVPRGTMAG